MDILYKASTRDKKDDKEEYRQERLIQSLYLKPALKESALKYHLQFPDQQGLYHTKQVEGNMHYMSNAIKDWYTTYRKSA